MKSKLWGNEHFNVQAQVDNATDDGSLAGSITVSCELVDARHIEEIITALICAKQWIKGTIPQLEAEILAAEWQRLNELGNYEGEIPDETD